MLKKYIITDFGAVLFGEKVTHLQVAKGFDKVYSAGFCEIKYSNTGRHEIKCFGNSSSLKIDSIPEKDEFIILDTMAKLSHVQYLGFSIKDYYEESKGTKQD